MVPQGVKRLPYAVYLSTLVLGLGVSGVPAALYETYAAEFGFAPLTTTVIFSAYAAGALVAVLLSGAVSDRYGRKPVLIGALVLILAGLAVFVTADGVPALITARVLHGVGVGSIVVAGTAALLDLAPTKGEATGIRTGVGFNVGMAIAVLATALVVHADLHPLVTPFVAVGALSVVALVAIVLLPETHRENRTSRLHVARPSVPASIRTHFRFSALGVAAAWSVLGVLLSLYPAIASRAIEAETGLFGAAVVSGGAAAAGVSQLVAVRWQPRTTALVGNAGSAVVLLASIPAVLGGHASAIVAATVLLGFFNGLGFGGSLRYLTQNVPAAHRGEVMSAFYVIAYSAMAVPTVIAGWAATEWSPEDVFAPFMVVIAVLSTLAGVLGVRRERPRQPSCLDEAPAAART